MNTSLITRSRCLVKFLIAFVLTLSVAESIYSQRTGSIRGFVEDSTTNEVLSYCNIFVEDLNVGASTNDRGFFFIPSLPAYKKYSIRISYIGYQTKLINVNVYEDQITAVNIQLAPSVIRLQSVEKVGEKYKLNTSDISLDKIFLRDLEKIPQSVENDLFRSLQRLPGVSFTGDVSARYYVRGGSSDQNLILLNDAPVYSPFHALGLFSAIDPDVINVAEFYKGGFPLEFNGGISSLLRIISKDGNKQEYHGNASASLLSGKVLLEGPIPDGSFIIAGRKSYSTEVLKKFLNNDDIPIDFYDLSFKINYSNSDVMQDAKFTLHGFISGDNLTNSDPLKEDFKWTNKIFGFNYFQWVTDSPIFYEFFVYQSDFTSEVIPKFSSAKSNKNNLTDYTAGGNLTYKFDNRDEFSIGMKFINIKTNLALENSKGALAVIDAEGTNVSIFGKFKLLQFDNFGVDLGSRINFTRLAVGTPGQISSEPRLNLSYKLIPGIDISTSVGIYQQELTTISDENEVISIFSPWIIIPKYLNPERAAHYIAGIKLKPENYLSFSFEGYYKIINNFASLNDKKYFESDPDLIAGKGEAYGMEFSADYSTDNWSGTLGYTLAWAFKELNGVRYYPRYDSRHTVNLSFNYNFGDDWSAGVIWNYSSGFPFTQVLGYYNKLYIENLGARIFNFIPFTILDDRNTARLPDYHRLDLNISKKLKLWNFDVSTDISFVNVYDRKNLFYFDLTTGNRINMLPFLVTATIKIEI